jgi:hypothetical protein
MTAHKTTFNDLVVTFAIGFTAGISPFVFMQILPSLLNSSHIFPSGNYSALIITGILVGVVSAIMFSTSLHKKDPQEIFLHALGIPAILIATVSNISTNYEANNAVQKTKTEASQQVLADDSSVIIESAALHKTVLVTPVSSPQFQFIGSAQAQDHTPSPLPGETQTRYVVYIGKYANEQQAQRALSMFSNKRFGTETYRPKNLELYEISGSQYIISYAVYNQDTDARTTYRLLRINDPELSLGIIRLQ